MSTLLDSSVGALSYLLYRESVLRWYHQLLWGGEQASDETARYGERASGEAERNEEQTSDEAERYEERAIDEAERYEERANGEAERYEERASDEAERYEERESDETEYRPPPLLWFKGKTRTKDKYRVVYSDAQRLELEKEFRYNNYITIKRKLELSRILGLTDRQVKIWFQNRRAKERKQKRRMEETAKRQLIDLQQNGSTGGGTDMQIGINHSHLQGVHGLVPLHRQAAAGAAAGGGGGGSEAGRFPRYPMAAGHPMHPDMVSPQQPAQHQHQHHQQHQQHQQHQLVAKSEPHDGEPPAF